MHCPLGEVGVAHLDFLEKIAEGFVIEAYNSTKSNDSDRISLRAYNRLSHQPVWPSCSSLERSIRHLLCRGENSFSKTGTVLSPLNTRKST